MGDKASQAVSSPSGIAETTSFAVLSTVILGFLAYSNTFGNAFVFDDLPEIVGNHSIRDLGEFLGPTGYYYNPRRFVAYLSFALNNRFGGLNVTGYHVVNLVVHVINALLVRALVLSTFDTPRLRGLFSRPSARRMALLAGLLFVVHPLQTQAVTYIVQRMTSLMTTFYIGSVLFYAKWRAERETSHVSPRGAKEIACLAAFGFFTILAMKTKENAFTLPAMVLLFDGLFYGGTIRRSPVVLTMVLASFLIIPLSLLDIQKPLREILSDAGAATYLQPTATRWEYLLTEFRVVATYIRLIFLPMGQNLDYDFPISRSLLEPKTMLSALFLVVLAALAILMARKARRGGDGRLWTASFGILWFFVALSVESSLIPITDVIFEHRVYLPSVGAFVGLSAGFETIRERWLRGKGGRVAMILAAAALGILALATYQRNAVWANRLTLWQDVVAKSPRKARGYTNLGAAMVDSGRREEGIALLEKAIALKPDYPEPYNNLGAALAASGRREQGIVLLEKAVSLAPDYPEACNNLGAALVDSGRREEGIPLLKKAIAMKPDYAEAFFNLGSAYLDDKDRPEDAILLLMRAVALNPRYTDAYVNLGAAYNKAGRFHDSVRVLREVLRAHPERADAHFNLGVAYAFMGNARGVAEETGILQGLDPGMAGKLRKLMPVPHPVNR